MLAATVEGRVNLIDSPKNPRLIKCYGKSGGAPQLPPEPPVAVIYLEGKFDRNSLIPTVLAPEHKQKGLQFSPQILPFSLARQWIFLIRMVIFEQGQHFAATRLMIKF